MPMEGSAPGGGLTPEQEFQYQILVDVTDAVNELEVLAKTAATIDERMQKLIALSSMLGEKYNLSGTVFVKKIQEMDKAFAGLESAETGVTQQSVIFGQTAPQAFGEATQAIKRTEGAATALGHGIDFIRVALGTMAAVLVFQVMNAISQTFTRAVELAKEFEISIYNIKNAERIMSEAGVDVTFKDLLGIVDQLSEKFRGMFSKTVWQDIVADIAVATKDLQFTSQQIQMLSEAIGAVQLRHPELTLQQVEQHALTALLSGRTQALQNMGIAANEATVKEKALEMGLIQEGEQLTAQQKSLAILQIMYDSTSQETQDLTERQNTLAGASQTLTAAWEDFTRALGVVAAPAAIEALNGISDALKSITGQMDAAGEKADRMQNAMAMLSQTLAGYVAFVQAFVGGLARGLSISAAMAEAIPQFFLGVQDAQRYMDQLSQSADTATAAAQGTADAISQINAADLSSVISQVQSLANQLQNLNQRYATQSANALEDLNTKLFRMRQDYNNRVADANRRYHNREIDDEAKFQEKMRQLRQKYLFDLEDALRERDARQVLRLQAKYQMDKEAAINEHNLQKEQNARQHEEELAQSKRDEQLKEQRAIEDYNIAKARRDAQYQQDLADLKASWEEKLKVMADKLGEQYGLNKEQTDQLYKMLLDYFGPDGSINGLYDYSYGFLKSRAEAMAQELASLAQTAVTYAAHINSIYAGLATAGYTGANMQEQPWNSISSHPGGHARGGIDIVNRPTRTKYGALYGEAGPEAHIFLPLRGSSASSVPNLAASMSGGGGMGGRATVEVMLSPDLEGRIMDNTLDQAAVIITRVQRSKG